MAFGDNQGNFQREPRQMFKGSWKCSNCNAEISELPFEPDPARIDQLLCRNCHMERRKNFRSRQPRSFER